MGTKNNEEPKPPIVPRISAMRAKKIKRYKFSNYSLGQVFIPKGKYSGQKLIMLVSKNTAPNNNNTKPKVPLTVPVKYKTEKIRAIITLIILSAVPMFFHCLKF